MTASTGPDRPIFVVGAPRSGTTLVRYVLCSHPRIYLPPESNFIPRFFRRRPTAPLSRKQALRILERIGDYRPFWRDWNDVPLNPQMVVDELTALTPAALIGALYARYAHQHGAVRWGDKSPMYASYVDLIAQMFPASQIIHIIRDGRDATASSLDAFQGRRFPYMDSYYAGRTWQRHARKGIAAGRRLPPGRYHEIRYEDLTADPTEQSARLCRFLGEEFHPVMAAPQQEARRHHHTEGIHSRTRDAVTTASCGRWRTDLTPADQRLVQRLAGGLLLELGYPLEDLGRSSAGESARAVGLRAKYTLFVTGRRVLQEAGLFHPTRLLAIRHARWPVSDGTGASPARPRHAALSTPDSRLGHGRASTATNVSEPPMTEPVLRLITSDQYAAWFDANRAALLHRSPFHDPAWLAAVARGLRLDLGFIGVHAGGEFAAVVPGFLTRRWPFGLFGSPLRGTMTSYLGPVALEPCFATGDGQRALVVACADFARRAWHLSYARFVTRDAPPDRRSPPGPDWHEQRPKSYRLDLSPGEEALFAGLRSHCRRNVRKASREGVVIVPLDDPRLFYRILRDTFRRHGSSSAHPLRFFETLMSELPPRGLLSPWGARYDDQIIAVGLFLHDDEEMHFISGASLPDYGSLPTSYLLHWHAIATAARRGLRVFNSEASKIPSIDHFKETFNPQRECRSTLVWAPAPAWRAQRAFLTWHKSVRHLRGKLPVGASHG